MELAAGIKGVDVIYMTRIQKERFAPGDYERYLTNQMVLTPQLLNSARDDAGFTDAGRPLVLHPLPRNDEINPVLDGDPRSVYFAQAQFGMFVRMALLTALLGRDASLIAAL